MTISTRTTAAGSRLPERPVVRSGVYAWALVGMAVLVGLALFVLSQITLVAVPLGLALFPAAVLYPAAVWLKGRGLPDAAAAGIVLVGFILVIAGLIAFVVPQVSGQIDSLAASLNQGLATLQQQLSQGIGPIPPIELDELVARAQDFVSTSEGLRSSALAAAGTAGRFLTGLVLALFALFFYLKDGRTIARWAVGLAPRRIREDARQVLELVWSTIGGYIRGQLLVAAFDAFFIGLGLVILGVPLAVPLGVLVLFGSLFPIVGALLSGSVAVLVALTQGVGTAVIALAIVLGVQQLEGNLLQPLILGRATALHPLAVISALTIGGSLLGVLGAFIAVPIAAALTRASAYIRERVPD